MASKRYDELPVGWQWSLWPALVWIVTVFSGLLLWLVAPQRLAVWAMPAVGRPKPPKWKWLATALSLYGFLGCTRRALGAWLKRHDAELFSSRFAKHPAVTEHVRYCDLGHEEDIEGFAAAVRARQPALR